MPAKHTILIVDDEPGIQRLLTFELKHLGYETITAGSADEALLMLRHGPFDLVISDIRMPGTMDGIDLIETYRKENPGQKVIFITGYAIEEKLARALKNPLNICFKKPFDICEFTDSVARCFQ